MEVMKSSVMSLVVAKNLEVAEKIATGTAMEEKTNAV